MDFDCFGNFALNIAVCSESMKLGTLIAVLVVNPDDISWIQAMASSFVIIVASRTGWTQYATRKIYHRMTGKVKFLPTQLDLYLRHIKYTPFGLH